MASTSLQAERFVKIIKQHLEILKEESNSVTDAVDHRINQVQWEVNAWIKGGSVNQTTYNEMNNRIQESLTLFLEKSAEILGKQIDKNKTDLNQTTNNNLTIPGASLKPKETKIEPLLGNPNTAPNQGSDDSQNMTMRFARLEEAVYSLKKTTEKVEDKIENVEKILKGVSTQQVNDHKKVDILINAKLETEKKINNKIMDLEKRYQDIKSNVDHLIKTVTNVDGKLYKLEDENKSGNVSMNELNKEISSVRTCSNDALISIQDLSKSVESTNQHYNEMSNKMNQLEISINLMSSQYTEQFENMDSLNKDKTDDLKEAIEIRVAEMSNKITEMELKCNPPKVAFYARKIQSDLVGLFPISKYTKVDYNHGGHFDQSTGKFTAPLNGLYLVTIMTENPSNTNLNTVRCCTIRKNTVVTLVRNISKNQTITRIAKTEAGDKICLEWTKIDKNYTSLIFIYFSCYMLQMWT